MRFLDDTINVEKPRKLVKPLMYYYSKNSARKIYHTKECGYVNLISEENLKKTTSKDKLFNKGYTFCEHCSPAGKYLRANRGYLKNRPKKARAYTIRFIDGDIEIFSQTCSYLLVFLEGKKMRLYHENSFEVNGVESEIPGYHLQSEGDYCLSKIMKYIIEHDKYRKTHPVQYNPRLSERILTETFLKTVPREYLKVSDEKSERMKRIDSYHEHGNRQKPRKSGGGRGQRRHIGQKRKEKQKRNSDNAARVNMLLGMLSNKSEQSA